jgi:hypothetical protein
MPFDWKFRSFRWQTDCFLDHDSLNLVPLYDVPRFPNISKPELFFEEGFWIDTVDPINKALKPILAVIGGFLASSVGRFG